MLKKLKPLKLINYMQKNENKFHSIIRQKKNNLLNIIEKGSNPNLISKFNKSRNLLLKLGNKAFSNIDSYNNMLSNFNDSKENPNKNEELNNNFINSSNNKKNSFINSVQLDINYLSKFPSNNIKSKIFWALISDKKNNENNLSPLNKTPQKRKKIDFIKYKFLLGQRNYYQRYDYDYSPFYYKKKYPYLNISPKKLHNKDKILKKFFYDRDSINAQSMKNIKDEKEVKENISNPSTIDMKNIFPKSNNIKPNNYTSIKIKKYNNSSILSSSSNKLRSTNNFEFEYNIRSIKNIIYERLKEIEEYNKLKEKNKIIDDNYNEYLNRISPSDSKIIINKNMNIKLKNKNKNKKLKIPKNIIIFNVKKDENKHIRKIKRNNNSNLNINYNNSFDCKKLISNKKKNVDDISKNIIIGNGILREKIMLE